MLPRRVVRFADPRKMEPMTGCRAVYGKSRRCFLAARGSNGSLRLLRQGLATAHGFGGMTGNFGRFMRRMVIVMRVLMMGGRRGLIGCRMRRAWNASRQQDACKIENRKL